MVRRGLVFGSLLCVLFSAAGAWAQTLLTADQARLEVVLDAPAGPPYERQMILGVVRGVYHVDITLEDLTIPRMRDVEWVQLARDVWTEERVDGRPARVLERRMAFFPQRAGTVRIKSLTHDLEILGPDGRRMRAEIRSAPVSIDVRPAPARPGDWWLPVAALEIHDSWDKDASALADGDSAERTVVLRALGATAQMAPPQPPMREPWLITFTPPEERRMELTPLGPLTTVVWKWRLRPKTGEPGVLPEVPIPWFDTTEGAARVAALAAAPFGYESGAGSAPIQWRAGFESPWVLIACLLAGFAPTCLLLASGGTAPRRDEIAAWIAITRFDPDRAALRRAARRGDEIGFRRAAARLVRRRDPRGREDGLRALAPLDRRLYGAEADAPHPDLKALARELCRARS